jgi:hypothetical protein
VDRFIMANYKRLIGTYLKHRELIPAGNLIEISYEDLIRAPAEVLSEVTGRLDLSTAPDLSATMDSLAGSRDFPRRKYQFSNAFIKEVNSQLGAMIEHQGYRTRTCFSREPMNA